MHNDSLLICLLAFVLIFTLASCNVAPYTLTIKIITYNRPDSLNRLLQSLARTKPLDESDSAPQISLHFHIENNPDPRTRQVIESFHWSHPNLHSNHIFERQQKGGLVNAIVESWYPASDRDYALILEDDVELSSYWLHWVHHVLTRMKLDDQVFGIALYTPRWVETKRFMEMRHEIHVWEQFDHHGYNAFALQVPCSWGAVWSPKSWIFYREYLRIRNRVHDECVKEGSKTNSSGSWWWPRSSSKRAKQCDLPFKGRDVIVHIPDTEVIWWSDSWVKFYMELAYMRGWYMIYPNFPNEASFSTNHVESGVHVKADAQDKHPKHLYTVPLLEEWSGVKTPEYADDLLILDYHFGKKDSVKELEEAGKKEWDRFIQRAKRVLADAKAPEG